MEDRRRDERRTPARRRDVPIGLATCPRHATLWSQDPASAVEELEAQMESTTTSVQVSAAAL